MLGLGIQGLGFRVWEGVSSYKRLYKGSTRVPCPGKATVIETCDGVLEVQGASMCLALQCLLAGTWKGPKSCGKTHHEQQQQQRAP